MVAAVDVDDAIGVLVLGAVGGCFCVRLRDDDVADDEAVLVVAFSVGDVSLDGVDALESD